MDERVRKIHLKNVFYLPSGRVFLYDCEGYLIESTEMRDVKVDSKEHKEVREATDPRIIWKHLRPYQEKWLLTVSTQKGCEYSCRFCDVANLPFKGNLTRDEIKEQVLNLMWNTPYVFTSKKVKIGFARMGEPAHNLDNVLEVIKDLPRLSSGCGRNFNWLPCFNSILPRKTIEGYNGFQIIDRVLAVKERNYNGFLHFQISCNSTNEEQRKKLFGGADVLTLEEIIGYINHKDVTNRTITLNFIVMNGVEVDIEKLKSFGLNNQKFVVKLIPLNHTLNSEQNGLETYANYRNYEKLLLLKNQFEEAGIPVVVDAIAKCEEAGLCCGQLAQIFQS